MSRIDQAMAQLADRMHLPPEAAKHLPVSVASYAKRLNMSESDLIQICPLAPALMSNIAQECRENAA